MPASSSKRATEPAAGPDAEQDWGVCAHAAWLGDVEEVSGVQEVGDGGQRARGDVNPGAEHVEGASLVVVTWLWPLAPPAWHYDTIRDVAAVVAVFQHHFSAGGVHCLCPESHVIVAAPGVELDT